jgi:tetratricopeptide (TPR) repeat protein
MGLSTKRASLYGFLLTLALLITALAAIVVRHGRRRLEGPDGILERADQLAWLGNWDEAAPLYSLAETLFVQENRPAKALYARVSQLPASAESISLPVQIQQLNKYLLLPAAQDPETKLRILVVLGMSETNYDAALARSTWSQVQQLARSLHHYMLASRAMGEQGIAAFMLGDTARAKREVISAWLASVVLRDPAAHVRYASVFGAGLVEMRRYQEALKPLDEAIKTAKDNPGVAYPIIAISSKIDALRSQHRYEEALGLSSQALTQIDPRERGHLYQIRVSQGQVYEDMGDGAKALSDYTDAIHDAAQLNYWRGITQAGGILARAYEHLGDFQSALKAIDQAIKANARISQELYFVPRNLAIKAEIEHKLGAQRESDDLLFMNDHALQSLLTDKFKLGADASVAAGPVGRSAADTDVKLHAEILSYSRSKGLFAGISLDGAVVQADKSGDQAFYGADVDRHAVLDGMVPMPASARNLMHELHAYPGTAIGM